MNDECQGTVRQKKWQQLKSGIRRGAAAGGLSGGLMLLVIVFLWAIGMMVSLRGYASWQVFLGLPMGIAFAWPMGLVFGAVCGACGGFLRTWSRKRLASVAAGALVAWLVWWAAIFSVLVNFGNSARSPEQELCLVVSLILATPGIIPGVCGAFWGAPESRAAETPRDAAPQTVRRPLIKP